MNKMKPDVGVEWWVGEGWLVVRVLRKKQECIFIMLKE